MCVRQRKFSLCDSPVLISLGSKMTCLSVSLSVFLTFVLLYSRVYSRNKSAAHRRKKWHRGNENGKEEKKMEIEETIACVMLNALLYKKDLL